VGTLKVKVAVTEKVEYSILVIFFLLASATCYVSWEKPIFLGDWIWQLFLFPCFFAFWFIVAAFIIWLLQLAEDKYSPKKRTVHKI
jgi:hypothetical protein